MTPEGVDQILNEVGIRFPIALEKGATLEDRKAGLLASLNAILFLMAPQGDELLISEGITKKLNRVERRAAALSKELKADSDGYDIDLKIFLMMAADAQSSTYSAGGTATIDNAVAGVLQLRQWAAHDFDYMRVTKWHKDNVTEKMLITVFLPHTYEEYFARPFAINKSDPGPGLRFVHTAHSLMVSGIRKKTPGAIAQLCARHLKTRDISPTKNMPDLSPRFMRETDV